MTILRGLNGAAVNCLLWTLVVFLLVSRCRQQGNFTLTSDHVKIRLDGKVMLKGLFPITSQRGKKCDDLNPSGVMWFMAMVYAVNKINDSPDLLRNITLGYEIDDTCSSIPTSMKYAIQIVSKYRPNSVCRFTEGCQCHNSSHGNIQDKRFSAVIGPASSWISIPVARLLGLYTIPQISYASTSRILGDTTRYNSFLRTVPSDEFQAQAMAQFVHDFHWNYVFLIASDDDYGKMGAAAFKTAAKNLSVCIANDAFVPFTSPNSESHIEDTILKLKSAERAKVVVVFSYLYQGELLLKQAQKWNITDRTWVTSDGWSSVNSEIAKLNVSKEMLNGIFSFSINSKQVKNFDTFVRELTVQKAYEYPWFLRYLEENLNCKAPSKAVSSLSYHRICDHNAVLPADHEIGTDFVANVIDAVSVIAHAIHNILNCTKSHPSGYCSNTTVAIPPEKLFEAAAAVNFQGVDYTAVEFDENGERTTSDYVIRNLQQSDKKTLRYVDVGRWSRNGTVTIFHVNETLIAWNFGTKPQSTCFRECSRGEKMVGQSECCWNCQKCDKGHVSYHVGSLDCTPCNETHYANEGRTECILREVVYMKSSEPAGVSILVLSCLGIIVVSAVVVILFRARKTPVVADTSPYLSIMFFVPVYISFIVNIIQVSSPPSDAQCAATGSMLVLMFALYSAFFLAKTQITTRFLTSTVSRFITTHIVYLQLLGVGLLLFLQVVLIIIWQATSGTKARFLNQEENNTRLLECYEDFPPAHMIAIFYAILVLLIATALSFRERRRPENFNEAKAISFSTIALCIVLLAFIPTYRYVVGKNRILVVAFSSFVAAFSCTGCLFIPKLYIIFFRPERNSLESDGRVTQEYTAHPRSSTDQISSDVLSNQDVGHVNFGAPHADALSNGRKKGSPFEDNISFPPARESTGEQINARKSDKEEASSVGEVLNYAVL